MDRYSIFEKFDVLGCMEENASGKWCKYEDVKELEEKLKIAEGRLEDAFKSGYGEGIGNGSYARYKDTYREDAWREYLEKIKMDK